MHTSVSTTGNMDDVEYLRDELDDVTDGSFPAGS